MYCRYYAICTLNQFVFTPKDEELAQKLVTTYFTFFKVRYSLVLCASGLSQACTRRKELDARMLAALLTGVNRAFPFVKGGHGQGAAVLV